MEGEASYPAVLREAIARQRAAIEQRVIPSLRENIRILHSSFQALYNVLVRKSLIGEDPYKYDTKISEVEVPSDEGYMDSERDEQLAIRLSYYESQLDFLNTSYEFSLEFLTLRRLKTLVRLARYIRWGQFSPGSTSPTTRGLAEQVGKLKAGSDRVSSSIVGDSLNQLVRAERDMLSDLKSLTAYQKEAYKSTVRDAVIGGEITQNGDPEEIVRSVKRKFAAQLPDQPFFPDLVAEIVAEDVGADKERLRKEVLESIKVDEEGPIRKKQGPDHRAILMEAVRAMANASRPLDECVQRLVDNNQLLSERKMGLGERFRRWLRKIAGQPITTGTIELEYVDVATSARQRETINYDEFMEDVSRRARVYNGIIGRVGNTYRRLEAADDDQVLAFLTKQIEELQMAHRRMQALDTYFKSETPRESRGKLRGIKIELSTLKNAIVNANQKRAEYVSRREETEQLKRLGIRSDD